MNRGVLRILDCPNSIAFESAAWKDHDLSLWNVVVLLKASVDHVSKINIKSNEPLVRVGAAGFDRNSTLIRACGEAVERHSLFPSESDLGVVLPASSFNSEFISGSELHVARSAITEDFDDMLCISAFSYADANRQVHIPVGLVNDDALARSEDQPYDPGPSGAAAGLSMDAAVEAALLESIERDAIQCAWLLRPRLDIVSDQNAISLLKLGSEESVKAALVITRLGLTVHIVPIPTGILGLFAYVAIVKDIGLDIVAAGAAVGEWRAGVGRACREALQVLSLLRNVQLFETSAQGLIRREFDRAVYWSSTGATALMANWLDHMQRVRVDSLMTSLSASMTYNADSLHEAMNLAGLDPLFCDLSHRIPNSFRAFGWCAVKSIVPGHQVLRMNEELNFTLNHSRLDRMGNLWPFCNPVTNVPHPFI